jgi:psiF repeat-containing protein
MRASSGRLQAAAILVCSSIHQPFGEAAMRLAFAASALCLSTLGLSLLAQAAQPVTPPAATPTAIAAATPAATPAATAPSPAPVASDAAAKHVKRTACLKEAKTKKLIGADKTAFLKSCIEAQEPISASRQTPPDRP